MTPLFPLRNRSRPVPDRLEQGRWYWHCRACDRYVPREREHCACGAKKVRRSEPPAEPRSLDRTLLWEASTILFLGGLGLLWVLLE